MITVRKTTITPAAVAAAAAAKVINDKIARENAAQARVDVFQSQRGKFIADFCAANGNTREAYGAAVRKFDVNLKQLQREAKEARA